MPLFSLYQMALESAVETANDKHLAPWLELLKQYGIEHTPLSPFIHIELLRQNHLSIGQAWECSCSSVFPCAHCALPCYLCMHIFAYMHDVTSG